MKRRLQRKYFKRVASGLKSGKQIPNFYIEKVRSELTHYFDRKYITEFRPWWYDQLEDRNELNLSTEIRRFCNDIRDSFGAMTGIDMDVFDDYTKAMQQQKRRVYGPKKLRRRKVKEQPIRKLKRPEQFYITTNDRCRHVLIGERVFQHRGFHFFIYRTSDAFAHYVVTDVLTGVAIARHYRYKKAVEIAKKKIATNFDSYLTLIKTIKRQQMGGKQS
ncbi:hypothetical protein [Paenibacillus alvei]|uniref:hypothetical protein n=1 Tax=Paenibacillus alvei TaxID=44250 RepID=UPI0018CCEC70|nr:hypothetical protein [Paenibacillus alvei]MBG9734568.1 hypothetical protein [Paenibacillus alvei]MBG9743121.1 hypothetical protein [Paenibacillus alvei]MCY9579576.1 hypothetical protein [Paenibacillus alvei]MCY9586536.1 hypothetical protein [Paenibacillus alvei]